MKKNIEILLTKYSFLKWATNRFVLVTLFFIIWMLFFDTYAYFDHRDIDSEISELEDRKAYYQREIDKDKKNIQKLNRKEEMERYAREKYYMKHENEDIFIIDNDKEYNNEEN